MLTWAYWEELYLLQLSLIMTKLQLPKKSMKMVKQSTKDRLELETR